MATRCDRIALLAAYLYLVIPVCIFCAGWLRPWYAVAAIMVIAVSTVRAFGASGPYVAAGITERRLKVAFGALLIAAVWVFFSGIGGWVFQNWDFIVRNAMLRDLITFDWPVRYHFPAEPARHPAAGQIGALVYYATYWLPVALFGKAFGWVPAQGFLYLYTVTGVLIIFYLFMRLVRRWALWIALIFIFWSGMDYAGRLVFRQIPAWGEHIEWWAYYFSYPAATSSLYWIFNQAMGVWIAAFLMLNQTNGRSVVFISLLALPYAPLPFVGLAPFVIYYILRRGGETGPTPLPQRSSLIARFGRALTFQNIAGAGVIAFIFLTYYGSNVHRAIILHQPLWEYAHDHVELLTVVGKYLLFCLFEFGIFAFLIGDRFRREPLFIIAVVSLVSIPWYCFGLANDFAMRVSMPALLVLSVYAARFFLTETGKSRIRTAAVLVCLLIGAVTPAFEIMRPIKYLSLHGVADDIKSFSRIEKYHPHYTALHPEERFFFRVLAKQER